MPGTLGFAGRSKGQFFTVAQWFRLKVNTLPDVAGRLPAVLLRLSRAERALGNVAGVDLAASRREGRLRGSGRALRAGAALAVLAVLAGPAEAAGRARPKPLRAPFDNNAWGTLQLIVSLGSQSVTLYSNGVPIAQSPVSTGTPDRPTPTGVFSVIEKDRWHRSNLYGAAPMNYMQRLTWTGLALHEGHLPGVAASHGCIRLPRAFAEQLWQVTRLGVRIVVAPYDLLPREIDHSRLFAPRQTPQPVLEAVAATTSFASLRLRTTLAANPEIEVASLDVSTATSSPPASEGKAVKSALGGGEPEKASPPTTRAIESGKPGRQIAIFVSRKEQKVFVRQGFVPLFESPIEIAQPHQPLGTHVFTALEFRDNGTRMRWNAITVPSDPWRAEESVKERDRRKPAKGSASGPRPVVDITTSAVTAEQALDRIQFPPEMLDRLGEVLTPGSSLVISDEGLGPETRRHTEFVVLTK